MSLQPTNNNLPNNAIQSTTLSQNTPTTTAKSTGNGNVIRSVATARFQGVETPNTKLNRQGAIKGRANTSSSQKTPANSTSLLARLAKIFKRIFSSFEKPKPQTVTKQELHYADLDLKSAKRSDSIEYATIDHTKSPLDNTKPTLRSILKSTPQSVSLLKDEAKFRELAAFMNALNEQDIGDKLFPQIQKRLNLNEDTDPESIFIENITTDGNNFFVTVSGTYEDENGNEIDLSEPIIEDGIPTEDLSYEIPIRVSEKELSDIGINTETLRSTLRNIEMNSNERNHGIMGREKAEKLLTEKPPGTALLREGSDGSPVISVKVESPDGKEKIKHIKLQDSKLTLEKFIETINFHPAVNVHELAQGESISWIRPPR